MNNSERISLYYVGVDSWDRVVFQSENGRFYKTADELSPDCGFLDASCEVQKRIFSDLYTCEPFNDPEGNPDGRSIWISLFM